MGIEQVGPGASLPSFHSHLGHLPAVQPWEVSLTSLKFSVLSYKTGITVVSTPEVRIK